MSSKLLIHHLAVDVQQWPKVLKAALVTILGCGMEKSWAIVLMQKCLQKRLWEVSDVAVSNKIEFI